MRIKYKMVVQDNKVISQMRLEYVCCNEMGKALESQETPFANPNAKSLWLYCPFCKEEIIY